MDKTFKRQLDERQEHVETLLKEMKEKEKEFEEYCRQIDRDRKSMNKLKIILFKFNFNKFLNSQMIETWLNRN